MVTINNYDEFAAYLGKNLGVSDYVELSQERINLFADATLDHQWIHVDTERAAVESPYKTTIAHGYLTLSMLPYLWEQVIKVNNVKMLVNYGEVRSAREVGRVGASRCRPLRHREPPRHRKGADKVRYRD